MGMIDCGASYIPYDMGMECQEVEDRSEEKQSRGETGATHGDEAMMLEGKDLIDEERTDEIDPSVDVNDGDGISWKEVEDGTKGLEI